MSEVKAKTEQSPALVFLDSTAETENGVCILCSRKLPILYKLLSHTRVIDVCKRCCLTAKMRRAKDDKDIIKKLKAKLAKEGKKVEWTCVHCGQKEEKKFMMVGTKGTIMFSAGHCSKECYDAVCRKVRKTDGSKLCHVCFKSLSREEALKCGRCEHIVYCGTSCQADDWPKHKTLCRELIMPPSEKEVL